MGCFVISQTAAGVRFLLRSDAGQTLAVSKNYASLDTCKKGIRSLILTLPQAPVVNLCAGERGSNPKCEIDGEEGAYVYRFKSPNGKTVIESRPVQTEKAALRAISMLKEAVEEPKMMFWQKEGYVPLKLGLPEGAAKKTETVKNAPAQGAKPAKEKGEAAILPNDLPASSKAAPDPVFVSEAVAAAVTEPIRVSETPAKAPEHENSPEPAKTPASEKMPASAKSPEPAKVETPAKIEATEGETLAKAGAAAESSAKPQMTEKPAEKTSENGGKASENGKKPPTKKNSVFGIFGRIHKLR